MAGKVDEISRIIGAQEENLKGLNRLFEQHCLDDDRRHGENLDTLKAIEARLADISDVLKPLVSRVNVMSPIVDGIEQSRLKLVGAVSLASTILVGIGWLVTSIAGEAIKWVAAHIR